MYEQILVINTLLLWAMLTLNDDGEVGTILAVVISGAVTLIVTITSFVFVWLVFLSFGIRII